MISLPDVPSVAPAWHAELRKLHQSTEAAPPADLARLVREALGIDLEARYGGLPLPHPFGKASGQLSCSPAQVDADVAAGLAFVVLKTVIAEDPGGRRRMEAWAVDETRMQVERRRTADGRQGWTVTWKGRGWPGSLEEYQEFFALALGAGRARHMPIVPSVKFHLPSAGEPFEVDEYEHTLARLLAVWDGAGCGGSMLLEQDFSPTLAGDPRAADRDRILQWLERVPELVRQASRGRVRFGVKVMNALFDDAFQVAMLRTLAQVDQPPDYLIVFNRLYDPERQVAYGGWELSDRNLRVLDAARRSGVTLPPLSATGNICSGRLMLEYGLRGCENGQVHTFFQLPHSEYTASGGTRSARALHTLLLHPAQGLVVWLRHLHEAGQVGGREDGVVHFLDLVDGVRGTG